MNKTPFFRLLSLAAMLTTLLVACSSGGSGDEPPASTEEETGGTGRPDTEESWTPNSSIIEVKQCYRELQEDACSPITLTDDGARRIVAVQVTSSDASANFRNVIYVEDASAAIPILVEGAALWRYYPAGTDMMVDLTGLFIVRQEGGLAVRGESGPLTINELGAHLRVTGASDLPDPLSVAAFADFRIGEWLRWHAMRVRLAGVRFEDGGVKPFTDGDGNSCSRMLIDGAGETLAVVTAGYAAFCREMLPGGILEVTGIIGGSALSPCLIINDLAAIKVINNNVNNGDNGDNGDKNGDEENNEVDDETGDGTGDGTNDVTDDETGDDNSDVEDNPVNPLSVDDVLIINPSSQTAPEGWPYKQVWVKGVIVGYYDYGVLFFADSAPRTNVVIAADAFVTDPSRCVAVQLPSGEVRNALNLADNPANLGRAVIVRGDVLRFLSLPGVRSTSAYKWVEE